MPSNKDKLKGATQHTTEAAQVAPHSELQWLKTEEISPSQRNPRQLFDPPQLADLKKNIRQHGVLVPITVFKPKGQKKYSILDGERRYRCCVELKAEGVERDLPANIVSPPTKIAGLLYMFSIHNFREQWELMPTALGLKVVMEDLEESDNKTLMRLTGLSEPQIERCKILLEFPEEFQKLSLDPDPKTRIPSNFWIEAYPVLNLCEKILPDLITEFERNGLTHRFVEKYRAKRIKSVIHFRRIMEAYEVAEGESQQNKFEARLRDYILNVELETRACFDEFIVDNRRIQSAIEGCDSFIKSLQRAKLDFAAEESDRSELIVSLQEVKSYVDQLLQKLFGGDAPVEHTEEISNAGE